MENQILLVEDEYKTGELLKKALESENIRVTWVTDGREAVEILEKGKFDLVVLDLKLPGLAGDEVLEKIRKKDPYVLVTVYTNYEEPPMMKKLINLGIDAYVRKGPEADLWSTVEVIKGKLEPFSEEEIEELMDSLPDGFPDDAKRGGNL